MLDAANNRLLVIDQATSHDSRLFAIDLATGNRSLLAGGSNSSLGVTFGQTLDSANSRLLLAQYQPTRVSQLSLGTGQVTRFSDSNVGTGPFIVGGSLLLDGTHGNRSLLTSAHGAVVRVNLATGARTAVVPAIFPNSTLPFPPRYLAFDTRPGALPGQVLFSSGSSSNEMFLFSGNLINGTSSRITTAAPVSYGSLAEFPLDAPNGRLIVNYPPSFGQSRIAPLDVTSGTLGPALADSTIGTPSFGTLSAMALDNVPGGTTRLLAVDTSGVFAVDLATGARSVVSSTSVGGGTPPVGAYGLAVDSATRRAWAVSGSDGAVQWIDLVNGNRAIISGRIPGTQILVGTGPRIQGDFPRIVVDLAADVAYVTSNADNVLAVDLLLGDRVITAR